jgi:hypothetical protein
MAFFSNNPRQYVTHIYKEVTGDNSATVLMVVSTGITFQTEPMQRHECDRTASSLKSKDIYFKAVMMMIPFLLSQCFPTAKSL